MWLEGDHLQVLAGQGATAPLAGLTLPAGQVGAARAVLDGRRSVVVNDTAKDPRWHPVPGEEQVGAWLGVPLLAQGRLNGLLEWTDRDTAWFATEDIDLANEIARCAAPILYQARLLDDTRQRLRELTEPRPTSAAHSADLSSELDPVVQEALDYTGAQHAFAFVLDHEGECLRCVAAAGSKQAQLRRISLHGDGTLAGWDIPVGGSANRPGTGPSDREEMAAIGIGRALILPLQAGGQKMGILGVTEPRRGRGFQRDAVRLMTHLASEASLVLEREIRRSPVSADYDYEMVVQSSPLGVGLLAVNGEIRMCNPALVGLLSPSSQTLVDRNLSEFLVPNDARRLRHALEEVAITGQRRQVETRLQQAREEVRHTRMSLAYTPVANGLGGNIVVMVEDVSPLKILEEERVEHLRELREKHAQLEELDQLKSRFVSNVSHELRTPLAVIKLYATLARKGRPAKRDFYLQTIEQETHRLETMVENILDLNRMDRRSISVNFEPLVTQDVIAQIIDVYRETAEKQGIALKDYVEDVLPPLWADKNHLIQMLTNLLDNALKYTPRGGEVWVAARELGSNSRRMLEIAIGDGGVGIAEDEQEKIFERFYRGSNNTPGSTGTGLGLAIVKELMVQHGGKVTLKSRPGEGSVFALQFPLNQPRAENQS
jgi:PAS domain S-box-containing protein